MDKFKVRLFIWCIISVKNIWYNIYLDSKYIAILCFSNRNWACPFYCELILDTSCLCFVSWCPCAKLKAPSLYSGQINYEAYCLNVFDAKQLDIKFCISSLYGPLIKKNPEKLTSFHVYPPTWNRKLYIIACAFYDYHILRSSFRYEHAEQRCCASFVCLPTVSRRSG